MLAFLSFKIEFEKLFIITSITIVAILFLNVIYWTYYFISRKKAKNRLISPKEALKPKNKFQKILQNKKLINSLFVFFSLAILGLCGYAIHIMFNTRPVLLVATPENGSTWKDLNQPIYFEFDRPIDPKRITFQMVPEVAGEFRYPKSFEKLPFTRKIEFYPTTNFEPGTRVYLLVGGFNSLIGNHERYAHEANIETYELPQVIKPPQNTATEVLLDDTFTFQLDHEPNEYVDINFEFEPFAEFEKTQEGNQFTVKPTKALAQSTQYKLKVLRNSRIQNLKTKEILSQSNPEVIQEVTFGTVKAPENKNFSPSGDMVFTDAEIKFEFSQPMNPESVISNLTVTPELKFTPEWSDSNKVLVLKKATNLSFNTTYNIVVKAGTLSRSNTILEKELSYSFKTIGEAKVTRSTPNGGTNNALNSVVKVYFDQEVDKNSAQSKFTIDQGVQGAFSWENNTTMVFKPNSNLNYSTKYTYTVAAGVKSIKGQDSTKNYSGSFTTLSQTFVLNIPIYKQKYRFSCNLTAASMVLAYKGITRSQDDIYNAIPKDSTPRDKANGIWGDPDAGYVGQINGPEGYGVHWGPISNYLNSQGVSASVSRGMSLSQLAKEVEQGHPVIVWVWNTVSGPTWEHWTTPGGKKVDGLIGMHSYLVVGFVGSSDNPTSIIINDPWGNRSTLTASRFSYLWGFYGNTGVIAR